MRKPAWIAVSVVEEGFSRNIIKDSAKSSPREICYSCGTFEPLMGFQRYIIDDTTKGGLTQFGGLFTLIPYAPKDSKHC